MAVFTPVTVHELADFLTGYDVGTAINFKGIAEGDQNSNFLLETTRGRYFLTLYEERVAEADLPWYLAFMAHLAAKGLPVPGPIPDRQGNSLTRLNGKPACLIEFLNGVSVSEASPADAHAVGAALARMHVAAGDFTPVLANALGPASWAARTARCNGRLAEIDPALPDAVAAGLAVVPHWPGDLPRCTIHADLFPDNVLMLDGKVTGLIDFYFACTDLRAFDVAVTHAAWCFSSDGRRFFPERAAALMAGYASVVTLSPDELAALPLLGMGAALRFTLTRAYDWLNTPADALVTRKDPMAFARRLQWYAGASPQQVLGA
ncbi:MAG: homoserine kinase [Sphingomonadales bacterium]